MTYPALALSGQTCENGPIGPEFEHEALKDAYTQVEDKLATLHEAIDHFDPPKGSCHEGMPVTTQSASKASLTA